MKNDLAQLFVTGLGIGFVVCLAGIALCGLYMMARWAWELFTGWRDYAPVERSEPVDVVPERPAPAIVWPAETPWRPDEGHVELRRVA